ncbi:hypothetical protein HBB16_07115 [Pseudonocardia sp. MCCB 268]|nr:hypothetical protein [Pseudonocardia cytotoxica]
MIAAGTADLPALDRVPVHTPVSAKGLEFDAVIDRPERVRAANPADLYVSMTRAAQRLGQLRCS